MTRRNLAVVAILAAAAAWLLTRGGEEDPADRIREVIRRTVEAAEARDLGGIMEVVSARFAAPAKGLDRDGLKGVLYVQLRRGAWRKVFLTDAQIEVADGAAPSRAEVRLEALLASGREIKRITDVVPTNAAKYRFDLVFEREPDDEWRVLSADYEPLPVGGP